ncbi:MAG: hypothetical protein HC871_08655 [Rhizobiales bacterium]|nr:hypothetical protein [Hyphomicrobiales bacterium]
MTTQSLTLALQGGGAHGAFTWGVLDRLLEDETLDIQGISGTSAGAMNAGVLACGLVDGREAARAALERFWKALSQLGAAAFNPYQSTPFHHLNRPGTWTGRPPASGLTSWRSWSRPTSSTRSTAIRCATS